jgi:glutamate/tyrosine decarboxylase-like PLP-dependent enzyme
MPTETSSFEEVLRSSCETAISYLSNLDDNRVAATLSLDALRSRLYRPLTQHGIPPEQVIAELVSDTEGGIMGCAGGRFFAWVIGGALPAAVAADWLTTAWDQNAALYACSPAASVVEEVAGSWLKEVLGLPLQSSFALVSGCQMAHVTCLASARHALLAGRGWDVEKNGIWGAAPFRILVNSHCHGSIQRAVRLLGLGASHMVSLSTDDMGRVHPEGLNEELDRDSDSLTIVVLQAGDINSGACDRFDMLVPIAKRYGAWVHVDGAFGLWAAASLRYRHLVRGFEEADSWAADGHKWLNVPFDCGYAFVVHPETHRAAMSYRASYISPNHDARDQIDWNPEWSRRARGFPTYAALRQLGRDGISNLIERSCSHAHSLVTQIGQLPGAEVLCETILNQGLVRFLDPKQEANESDHAARTEAVIAAIAAGGEAFFSASDWNGHRVMRVSVCNWQTSDTDVKRAVQSVAQVLRDSAGSRTFY